MAEQPAMQQAVAVPMDGHGGVYPVHNHTRQYQDYPQFEGSHVPNHQDYPFADESALQLSPPDDLQRFVGATAYSYCSPLQLTAVLQSRTHNTYLGSEQVHRHTLQNYICTYSLPQEGRGEYSFSADL